MRPLRLFFITLLACGGNIAFATSSHVNPSVVSPTKAAIVQLLSLARGLGRPTPPSAAQWIGHERDGESASSLRRREAFIVAVKNAQPLSAQFHGVTRVKISAAQAEREGIGQAVRLITSMSDPPPGTLRQAVLGLVRAQLLAELPDEERNRFADPTNPAHHDLISGLQMRARTETDAILGEAP
jgi:hypothetical protein